MQKKYSKENREKRGKSGPFSENFSYFKFAKRSFCALFLIFLGGFLFNLDRMGDFGITLLKYKDFLPQPIPKFLPGGSAAFGTAEPRQDISGQVIEVYDGDTMTLLLNKENKKFRVRFYGIDAPEAAQKYGIDSRDALREKILGKNVVVKVAAVDRYQRVVGKVMLGGRHINLEMVREGNAWYYSDYAARQYELMDAEQQAKRAKIGLWADDYPEAPWKWRREHKK